MPLPILYVKFNVARKVIKDLVFGTEKDSAFNESNFNTQRLIVTLLLIATFCLSIYMTRRTVDLTKREIFLQSTMKLWGCPPLPRGIHHKPSEFSAQQCVKPPTAPIKSLPPSTVPKP